MQSSFCLGRIIRSSSFPSFEEEPKLKRSNVKLKQSLWFPLIENYCQYENPGKQLRECDSFASHYINTTEHRASDCH